MNKRKQAVLDELADIADELERIDARAAELKKRRAVLWGRGRTAGLDTATVAAASKVEPVTVRQWARRARLDAEPAAAAEA